MTAPCLRDVDDIPGHGGAVSLGLARRGHARPVVGVFVRPDAAQGDGHMLDFHVEELPAIIRAVDAGLAFIRTATVDANGCPSWTDRRLHDMARGCFHIRELATVPSTRGELGLSVGERDGAPVLVVFGVEEPDGISDGDAIDLTPDAAWRFRCALAAAAAALEEAPHRVLVAA